MPEVPDQVILTLSLYVPSLALTDTGTVTVVEALLQPLFHVLKELIEAPLLFDAALTKYQ